MNAKVDEIKAFFLDLDGTLLDEKDVNGNHVISQKNLDAIAEAQRQGKIIVASTGRDFNAASKFLRQINSPYAILQNGAIIIVKDQMVRNLKLSVKQALLIHDFAWKNNLTLRINGEGTAFGAKTALQKYVAKRMNLTPVENYNFEMHVEHTKMILWGKTKSRIHKLAMELAQKLPDASVVTSSMGWTIEITNIEATKGKADEFIASHYLKLPKEATAHVGDMMNDSTAIGRVGKMIAMQNSDKHLKAITKFRGPHFKNGGVAKVLQGEYWEV